MSRSSFIVHCKDCGGEFSSSDAPSMNSRLCPNRRRRSSISQGPNSYFVVVEGLRRVGACIRDRARLVELAPATHDLFDRCRDGSSTKPLETMCCRSELGCPLHCLPVLWIISLPVVFLGD